MKKYGGGEGGDGRQDPAISWERRLPRCCQWNIGPAEGVRFDSYPPLRLVSQLTHIEGGPGEREETHA